MIIVVLLLMFLVLLLRRGGGVVSLQGGKRGLGAYDNWTALIVYCGTDRTWKVATRSTEERCYKSDGR